MPITTWRNPTPVVTHLSNRPYPQSVEITGQPGVTRREVTAAENLRASRGWWDQDADNYQAEHGDFLGDVDFVWCPEGLREADVHLLGDVRGKRILELGCGAASASRWLATQGAGVVGLDLSAGMLRHASFSRVLVPLVQADAAALPFGAESFDIVCTAFGAVPFTEDSARVMREVNRVLRPGGRWVFSVTHPIKCIGSCRTFTREIDRHRTRNRATLPWANRDSRHSKAVKRRRGLIEPLPRPSGDPAERCERVKRQD